MPLTTMISIGNIRKLRSRKQLHKTTPPCSRPLGKSSLSHLLYTKICVQSMYHFPYWGHPILFAAILSISIIYSFHSLCCWIHCSYWSGYGLPFVVNIPFLSQCFPPPCVPPSHPPIRSFHFPRRVCFLFTSLVYLLCVYHFLVLTNKIPPTFTSIESNIYILFPTPIKYINI